MGRDIYRRIPEKYSNTKFDENLPSGTRVVLCGRTDRLDEASCRLSQFCEKARNVNIYIILAHPCVIGIVLPLSV